jgi:hypothetical protein
MSADRVGKFKYDLTITIAGNDGNKPKRAEHIVSKVVSDIEFRVKCKQEMELDRRRIRGEQTQPEK